MDVPPTIATGFRFRWFAAAIIVFMVGCDKSRPIEVYTIPTAMPAELRTENSRMVVAMVPIEDSTEGVVWFYKVTGSESRVESVVDPLKTFVAGLKYENGEPVLDDLPTGWQLDRTERQFRFATIQVPVDAGAASDDAPTVNVTISNLARQDDYEAMVLMNVNRWRGQLGLSPTPSAQTESFKVSGSSESALWIDLVGDPPGSASRRGGATPPFAGMTPPDSGTGGAMPQPRVSATTTPSSLTYQTPEGWTDLGAAGMRLASFKIDSDTDGETKLTVINAGGNVRNNVARWMGQVAATPPDDDAVDAAVESARSMRVDGRQAQRFILKGDTETIDATIIDLGDGFSTFVKMQGPSDVVVSQEDAIGNFLKTLEL